MKHVIFDMDGTLAEWREVKDPSEYFKKGFFITLKENVGGICKYADTLSKCADGEYKVFVLSAYNPGSSAYEEKQKWCDEHTPHIPREQRLFVPYGTNKAEFYKEMLKKEELTPEDVLVDDYSVNLQDWTTAGGSAIKWLNPFNGKTGTFKGFRTDSVFELSQFIFGRNFEEGDSEGGCECGQRIDWKGDTE